MDKKVIDRKYQIRAVNPVTHQQYDETNSVLFLAKDKALPKALSAYAAECERLGANREHIQSIRLLKSRVVHFQAQTGGGRVPDSVGAEIPRLLEGKGVFPPRSPIALLQSIETYGFSCEGGPLGNSLAWRDLKQEVDTLVSIERSYANQLGEMARLCDIVCSWALKQDLDEDVHAREAAEEIMQYVECVRPPSDDPCEGCNKAPSVCPGALTCQGPSEAEGSNQKE